MKLFLKGGLFCIYSLMVSSIGAQTTKEEMMLHIDQTASNYRAYSTNFKPQSKVPKGYQAFYVSHYGRHGSRYHYSATDFKNMLEILQKADSAEALTELGVSVKNRFAKIYEDGKMKAGDLTQKGVEQHKGIARRMVKNCPKVFKGEAKISAKSSTSVRCVLSMDAFCQELKTINPKLQITNEASKRLMSYICYEEKEDQNKRMNDTLWTKPFGELHYRLIHPSRMMSVLFRDKEYMDKNIDSVAFMRKLYDIHSSMQGMDSLNIDFRDVWTKEELYNNWRVQNAWWYANSGPCPLTLSKNPLLARNLLKNILDEAQKAVEGKGDNASLRFGHDMGILPLASLMGMQGCDVKTTDLENLHTVWTDFRIIPMGANIQLIFYRHKKNKNVIVKALLNENEVTLPLKSDTAPYYNWEDFYRYYSNLLKATSIK